MASDAQKAARRSSNAKVNDIYLYIIYKVVIGKGSFGEFSPVVWSSFRGGLISVFFKRVAVIAALNPGTTLAFCKKNQNMHGI